MRFLSIAFVGLVCFNSALGQTVGTNVRTEGNYPVEVLSTASSKAYAFEKLTVLNTSNKPIVALRFQVTTLRAGQLTVIARERFEVGVRRNQQRTIKSRIGSMSMLQRVAVALNEESIQATLELVTVQFSDGSIWGDPDRLKSQVLAIPSR